MKTLWLDSETTGVNPNTAGIWQLSCFAVIDGIRYPSFTINIKPHEDCEIVARALEVGNITKKQLESFTPEVVAFKLFTDYLDTLVDKYQGRKQGEPDRLLLCGFKTGFDAEMLRSLFARNSVTTKINTKLSVYGSYFFSNGVLDVQSLFIDKYMANLGKLPNWQLMTCITDKHGLNKIIDTSKAHGAKFDILCTYGMYCNIKGIEDKESKVPYVR